MPDVRKEPEKKPRTRTSEEISGIIGIAALLIGFILFIFLMARGCVPGLSGR